MQDDNFALFATELTLNARCLSSIVDQFIQNSFLCITYAGPQMFMHKKLKGGNEVMKLNYSFHLSPIIQVSAHLQVMLQWHFCILTSMNLYDVKINAIKSS